MESPFPTGYPNAFCIREVGGLMVSVLDSRVSGPGSSPGWEHCVAFLGKTLYSCAASPHFSTQFYKWVPVNLMLGVNPVMD